MWASTAKFQGSSKSKLHSIHWQESRDGNGGWLASGSAEGTVGVSWIASRAAAAPGQAVNVALTSEARLYKSHFMMKGHIGEVRRMYIAMAHAFYIVSDVHVIQMQLLCSST